MINFEKLKPVFEGYKDYFPSHWKDEKYKWQAVQQFQDHWNIDAENFGEMFKEATKKTLNLLASGYAYPRAMVIEFAEADDQETRHMFRVLFDESRDLLERVEQFKHKAEELRQKYDDGTWKNHYQNTNAISTYLWLRYPDKYYIYKYTEYRKVALELSEDYKPKHGGSAETMIGGFRMYDEINAAILDDTELVELHRNAYSDDCYNDPFMKTATIDVGFYLSRFYNKDNEDWFPKDYQPGLRTDDWLTLLQDTSVFTPKALQIVKRLKDNGGQATCTQLSNKYGESVNFYNRGSSSLARRIFEKTNCHIMETENKNIKWWPILYIGKKADDDIDGSYVWRLREELNEALEKIDLTKVKLYAKENPNGYIESRRYWWLTASPKIWSFSEVEIGGEESYTLFNGNGNKRRIHQNFLDAKVGDLIIGYESNPVKKIVALGKITQSNDGERIYFEKTEGLSVPIEFSVLKAFPELEKMEFFAQQNGSLFKLTKNEFDFIMDIIREENPINDPGREIEKYTKEDFLSVVYMPEERYDVLESLLRNKLNVILQGAPGVGKTFLAKRLAYSMMGQKDDSRIQLVQFHQNYSYEDFIMGYRPDGADFKLTDGIFYRFCQKAANNPDKKYFFIIDEINRGNLSKIFGELLMLIEKGYRDTKVTLAYNGMPFSIPQNIFIIGTMNTADRSLAMIDYALRRRFSFYDMEPGFNSEGFQNYQDRLANDTFNALVGQIKALNRDISADRSLGKGFRIGHSYFCEKKPTECTADWMRSVVEFDILPMLSEYWFDDTKQLEIWEQNLRGVFDD